MTVPALTPGTVFYMTDHGHDNPQPHYYVVLNADPAKDELLVMAYATSKVEKRVELAAKRGFPPATIVHAGPTDYAELNRPTVFDCNSVLTLRKSTLEQRLEDHLATVSTPMSDPLLRRIIAGAHASTMVAPKTKRMLPAVATPAAAPDPAQPAVVDD